MENVNKARRLYHAFLVQHQPTKSRTRDMIIRNLCACLEATSYQPRSRVCGDIHEINFEDVHSGMYAYHQPNFRSLNSEWVYHTHSA